RQRLGLLRVRDPVDDLRVRERLCVELVPRSTAGLRGDRLREVVLRPRRLPRKELLATVVHASREAPVQLGRGHVQRFRHRPGHRSPVELVARDGLAAACQDEVDSLSLRAGVRPTEQAALARKPNRVPAGRDDERLAGRGFGCRELDLSGRANERVRQPARLEPAARRELAGRVARDHRRAEPLEPVDRLVEAFPDQPLELGIAAGALAAEFDELAIAPDHAAGEPHRPAGPVAFLEHAHASGGDEAGHPRSENRDRQRNEKLGLCSTYSSFTRSGPQTKTANVFAASTTSATSNSPSRAGAASSTSTARWLSSGRSVSFTSPGSSSRYAPPTSSRPGPASRKP